MSNPVFRRWSPVFSLFGGLLLTMGLASGAPPQAAQTAQPQPEFVLLSLVDLKPETATQWAEVQQAETLPAQRKGGLAFRETWATAALGNLYQRGIVTPVTNIGQFDGPNAAQKALGQDGARALTEKTRKLINGSHNYLLRLRPDLGFGTRPAKLNLAMLTTVTVANGRTADFEALLKSDVVPGLKKANVGYYSVAQVVYGGDSNQFMTLLPFENFAELAKGHPLERSLGSDGFARLAQKTAPIIAKLERSIIRLVPELSFRTTN